MVAMRPPSLNVITPSLASGCSCHVVARVWDTPVIVWVFQILGIASCLGNFDQYLAWARLWDRNVKHLHAQVLLDERFFHCYSSCCLNAENLLQFAKVLTLDVL
jgi:hypothetical protein